MAHTTAASQMANRERSLRQEDAREDTMRSLARERMDYANMASEERVENKRMIRLLQLEQKEREMEEAILKVWGFSFSFFRSVVSFHCHL